MVKLSSQIYGKGIASVMTLRKCETFRALISWPLCDHNTFPRYDLKRLLLELWDQLSCLRYILEQHFVSTDRLMFLRALACSFVLFFAL